MAVTPAPQPLPVIRPDDLLVLEFAFVNLQLDDATPPNLLRVDPAAPAYIVVGLPPQHLTERTCPAASPGGLGGTPPPVPAFLARASRLCFQVPDGTAAVPFTLAALLDWGRLTPSVPDNALPDPPVPGHWPAPSAPKAYETSLEVPYRLLLSPDATGGWAHAAAPVTRAGVTELWHTRLGVRTGDGGVDETRLPPVRAVWTLDAGGDETHGDPPGIDAIPLSPDVRAALVTLTADFTGDLRPYNAPPLRARTFTLSALGADLDAEGAWDPADGTWHPPVKAPVTAWRQTTARGRDQYVRVVQRGFLCPYGHRAALIEVCERRPQRCENGPFGAYLTVARQVVPIDHVRDYDALPGGADHRMPLRRVRITTDAVAYDALTDGVPTMGGTPVPFHLAAEDWSGAPVEFSTPLVFSPDGNLPAGGAGFTVALAGRRVALAPAAPSAAGAPDPAALLVHTLDVAGVPAPGLDPPFVPYAPRATVTIPAVSGLLAASRDLPPVPVDLLDPAATPGEVFARLSPGAALPVDIPADKAGGLATPNLNITDLSRRHGPVPPVLASLAGAGHFDPKDLFTASALDAVKLLGGISLADVIAAAAGPGDLPVLHETHDATGATITFDWSPAVRDRPPLVFGKGAALTIHLATTVPRTADGTPGPPTYTVDGRLTAFALDFGVITASFDELRFSAGTGRKADVKPSGIRLAFTGALQFLNELADALPAGGFSDGPLIRLTPDGVTAGYALGLPSAGIGVFSLENIALIAELALPFTANRPTTLRLGFSERAHPFLVSVSCIAGGGFFAVEIDTSERVRALEAAIEMGADITMSLAVVEANVHVMGGFYFGLAEDGSLTFSAYLRIGGSVELLGIAGMSIEIYLAMTYTDGPPATIGGIASVTVAVHVLFFSTSISLTAEKHFDVPGRAAARAVGPAPAPPPGFADLMTPADWAAYCAAFA